MTDIIIPEKYLTPEGILEDAAQFTSGASGSILATLPGGQEVMFGKNDIKIRDERNWGHKKDFYITVTCKGAVEMARPKLDRRKSSSPTDITIADIGKMDFFHEQPDWSTSMNKDCFKTITGIKVNRTSIVVGPGDTRKGEKVTRFIADNLFPAPSIEEKMKADAAWKKLRRTTPKHTKKEFKDTVYGYFDPEVCEYLFVHSPEPENGKPVVRVYIPKKGIYKIDA